MLTLSERPFFVVGNPRSGTTLLRFILSSHPRLEIPSETGFLPFLGFDADATLTLAEAREVLRRIGKLDREWVQSVDDVESLYRRLSRPRLSHLLDALYRRKIAGRTAERWGDKTPGYALYIPLLSRIFSTAQFVHIIRDGRDAILSAQRKWGRRRWYMDNHYLLRNWVRHVEAGCSAGRKLSTDRYVEIHYEELVQQPERVVRRICAFLGESFNPAMLDHTRLAYERIESGGHIEVLRPISTASVGRWQAEMSEFWQKVADRVAGPMLSACGYELSERGPLSSTEWLRLLYFETKYAFVQSGRQALTRFGMLTLNRNKRNR